MEQEARFDINPHVIRQLGAELITDQVTALMELIKNSYDADADFVNIVIDSKNTYPSNDVFHLNQPGYILIEDDGFGMDRETILKSWLTISYSNKRAVEGIKPKTPKGRTPLGDKGLGRLSTQRIAHICEIFTKKEGGEPLHVGFNWDDFDTAQRLRDVNVNFHSADSISTKHGTKLLLLNLFEPNYWVGPNLEKFKALLCQLIAPYEDIKPFNIYLSINGERIDLEHEIGKLNKLDVSNIQFKYESQVMEMTMRVNMRKLIGNDFSTYSRVILPDNGNRFLDYFLNDKRGKGYSLSSNGYWIEIVDSFSLDDLQKNKSIFKDSVVVDPGAFYGKIQEFNLSYISDNSDWWNQLYSNFEDYKNFVKPQIGIKIYRNGFAVRPYGINENDWLNLSHGQTGGSSYYGLRPGNSIGYIAIDEERNSELKDKTDREGLIENDCYRAFRLLVDEVVSRANEKMENLRRCYNDYRVSLSDNNTKVRSMKQALDTIDTQGQKGEEIARAYNDVQNQFTTIETKINAVIGSDDGLFADNDDSLSKQTLRDVSTILSESKSVLSQANDVLKNSIYLNEALSIIKPKLEMLEAQLNDFSELASLGLVSEMVSHDLGQISNRLLGKSRELEQQVKSSAIISEVQIYQVVEFINSTVTSLKAQIKHLDPSLKYNREKVETFSISKFLYDEELPFYSGKCREQNAEINIVEDKDFDVRMNKGRLIQVFDNLINNSLYWLNIYSSMIDKEDKARITITVSYPWVYLEDNGLGIDKSVESTLFEPFVTRKPKGMGRGLGLFIIRQLLDSIQCDVILDEKRNQYGNRYSFSINLLGVTKEK